MESCIPQRLVTPGSNIAPGQVVALIIDSKTAYLGIWTYPCSPPTPVDLYWPVLMGLHNGSGLRTGTLGSLNWQSDISRLLSQEPTRRFFNYLNLIFQDQLDQKAIDVYYEAREHLWPKYSELYASVTCTTTP